VGKGIIEYVVDDHVVDGICFNFELHMLVRQRVEW
jgi:hypothetical protein